MGGRRFLRDARNDTRRRGDFARRAKANYMGVGRLVPWAAVGLQGPSEGEIRGGSPANNKWQGPALTKNEFFLNGVE